VAQGCSAKRVVLVSLNRGHTFGGMKAVQGELSPLVMDLAPIVSRHLEAAIPFMTTQEGIGSRWGPRHSSIHSSYMIKERARLNSPKCFKNRSTPNRIFCSNGGMSCASYTVLQPFAICMYSSRHSSAFLQSISMSEPLVARWCMTS